MRITTASLSTVQDERLLERLCQLGDVVCVQGADGVPLSRAIPEGWRSLQPQTGSKARRGATIAYRRHRVRVSHPVTARCLYGLIRGGRRVTRPNFVQWADVSTDELTVRVFSVDLATRATLLGTMLTNLREFLRQSPYPVVVCGHWGSVGVAESAKAVGGVFPHGEGSTGILVDKRLRVATETVDRQAVHAGQAQHPAVSVTLRAARTALRELGS